MSWQPFSWDTQGIFVVVVAVLNGWEKKNQKLDNIFRKLAKVLTEIPGESY